MTTREKNLIKAIVIVVVAGVCAITLSFYEVAGVVMYLLGYTIGFLVRGIIN